MTIDPKTRAEIAGMWQDLGVAMEQHRITYHDRALTADCSCGEWRIPLAGVRNAAELGEAGAAHIRAEADKITAARTRPATPDDEPRCSVPPAAVARRQPAYDAVYEAIHKYPPRSTDSYGQAAENARVWRAVHAALEALDGQGPDVDTRMVGRRNGKSRPPVAAGHEIRLNYGNLTGICSCGDWRVGLGEVLGSRDLDQAASAHLTEAVRNPIGIHVQTAVAGASPDNRPGAFVLAAATLMDRYGTTDPTTLGLRGADLTEIAAAEQIMRRQRMRDSY